MTIKSVIEDVKEVSNLTIILRKVKIFGWKRGHFRTASSLPSIIQIKERHREERSQSSI